jgi:hypothetical protein
MFITNFVTGFCCDTPACTMQLDGQHEASKVLLGLYKFSNRYACVHAHFSSHSNGHILDSVSRQTTEATLLGTTEVC